MTAAKNTKGSDVSLPFAALQLLAPPVRLVSAALWKVLKQRDVMQYGVVEEFVTSACETIPGLLTTRHQGKLSLGLRARLILELCRNPPDVQVIQPHLERIRAPAGPSSSSRKDAKVSKTVENFHSSVHVLLTDTAERERFFQEEFPVEYGPKFDQELEKLLWEFLIRLDQLLPVPNLSQTVSWLTDAPSVLEECAQAATQPQLLEILLQHQTCLGHLEAAASLPPNMGDSILASLSLPLSGKVPSKQPTEAGPSSLKPVNTPTSQKKSQIQPVFGTISNEDVPVMAARKRAVNQNTSFTSIRPKGKEDEDVPSSGRSTRMKRKLTDKGDSDSDENEDGLKSHKRRSDSQEEKVRGRNKGPNREETKRSEGDEQSISSIMSSCLNKHPQVVLERLKLASLPSDGAGIPEENRKSPIKAPTHKRRRGLQQHGRDNIENRPLKTVNGCSLQQGATGNGDDFVADSEDEGTKNFKGRLFVKRYYKTKHGTYIPTLREFWKPRMNRQDLLLTDRKHRL